MEWEEYGKKFKLGRELILEKRVLNSLARKMPKNVCHSAIHPHSSFAHVGKLRSGFYLHGFVGYVLFLHDLGSWAFSSSSFTHVGAPSSSWEFVECEIHDFGFVVYFFLTWIDVLHILEAKNFVFVMFLWLGFFPNVLCCIPHCLSS